MPEARRQLTERDHNLLLLGRHSLESGNKIESLWKTILLLEKDFPGRNDKSKLQ